MNRDSIFYSSIRSLFSGFFALLGFGLAFILIIFLIVGLASSNTGTGTLDQTTEATVLPDAAGVRTSSTTAPVILQVNIDGGIGLDDVTMDKVRNQLMESREGDLKDRVKGVLVYINSPGGTVTDADGIYRALKNYKEQYKVPVIAYTEGLCASGGYYIACAADKIYAADTALIGSVGVLFSPFVNVSQLLDKIGVSSLTVSAGKGKDDMNPLRPWKPDEDASFRAICDYYYQFFLGIVTSNRPEMNKERLVADYGANVFPAQDAQAKGYIDSAGSSRSEALKLLAQEAKLEGETYQVVQLEPKTRLSDLFKLNTPIFSGKMKHEIHLKTDHEAAFSGKYLYLYKPE